MAINRDSCVFYASWLEAVETMPEAAQGEALKAILTFALRGEETAKQGAMTRMLMAMVRPQIEANIARWENGRKGGRPKVEKPNQNQNETKPKPNQNQTETYNVNVNDNVNVNVNESVCEKNAPAHTHAKKFQEFIKWCEAVAPLAIKFKEPLTVEHFAWLYDTYGATKLKQCATELHNKEASLKNRRAITAWKAFMQKIV